MPTRDEIERGIREFNERVFNQKDLEYFEDRLTDDFIEHSPMPGLGNDRKGAIETIRMLLGAIPDMKSEILQVIVSGNKFAVRTRTSGTDSGTGQMPGVPPTGKQFAVEGIDVVTVADDGRYSEHYGIFDVTSMMMQLGLMPPPPSG